jgi:hypothetical protein
MWIFRRRLEGARNDLATPTLKHRTIESVARSWGFTSAAYFSRRFRETCGTTPGEWRRLSSTATTPSAATEQSRPTPFTPHPLVAVIARRRQSHSISTPEETLTVSSRHRAHDATPLRATPRHRASR